MARPFPEEPPDAPTRAFALPMETVGSLVGCIHASCSFEDGVPVSSSSPQQQQQQQQHKVIEEQTLPDPNPSKKGKRSLQSIIDERKDVTIAGLSLPGLSLMHSTERTDLEARSGDRKQVEEYAATLLARRRVYGTGSNDRLSEETDERSFDRAASLDLLPVHLLKNITESFATLVACRLRAYATFLARHGISLAEKSEDADGVLGIEKKLTRLLDIGGNISARSLQLGFDVEQEDIADDIVVLEEQEGEEKQDLSVPVTLNVRMEVEIPTSRGEKKVIPLAISASGKAKCERLSTSDALLVHIIVDTRQLLSVMILRASSVIAAVVEEANTSSIVPESKLCRSSSFLAMPPPKPKLNRRESSDGGKASDLLSQAEDTKSKNRMHGLAILSTAAAELPIVSPDLRARALMKQPPDMPNLNLVLVESSSANSSITAEEQDLSDLSPDQCASIVDCIFGDFDDNILSNEPPSKKLKTT